QMRSHRVAQGRFFTDLEMENRSSVCVLSAEAAEKLFPLEVPVGGTIRILSSYYRVIGVMERPPVVTEAKELGETTSPGLGSRVYLPLETLKTHFGDTIFKRRTGSRELEKVVLHEVTVKVQERDDVIEVSRAVKELLERKHKKADYRMIVPL